jgi:uncharacterized membrane protein
MNSWFKPRKRPTRVQRNIQSIAQLEEEFEKERTTVDKVSDAVTRFAGSVRFIIAHGIIFGSWILLNIVLGPEHAPDPFPFQFLGIVVGVEAVFLSAFVLMSQNRTNRLNDQWAHVDLQISLLAEQETTQALKMLKRISDKLGLKDEVQADPELKELVEKTHVEQLVDELEKARENDEAAKKDTEAKPPGTIEV